MKEKCRYDSLVITDCDIVTVLNTFYIQENYIHTQTHNTITYIEKKIVNKMKKYCNRNMD
jgi:hypothetical protein